MVFQRKPLASAAAASIVLAFGAVIPPQVAHADPAAVADPIPPDPQMPPPGAPLPPPPPPAPPLAPPPAIGALVPSPMPPAALPAGN